MPGTGRPTAPLRPHHQQVICGAGDVNLGRAGHALHRQGLDVHIGRAACPDGIQRILQPLLGGFRPETPKVKRRAAPFGEVTFGRNPGMSDYRRRIISPRSTLGASQRRDATRRSARADDDPTMAGHGSALFLNTQSASMKLQDPEKGALR